MGDAMENVTTALWIPEIGYHKSWDILLLLIDQNIYLYKEYKNRDMDRSTGWRLEMRYGQIYNVKVRNDVKVKSPCCMNK